jgi:glycerol uptake facilitator-like aquaporin
MEIGKVMYQAIAEFLGCLILGVVVTGAKMSGANTLTLLPLIAWIPYMLAWRISNSHLNPAVTLVQILRKDYEFGLVEGILYMLAQFAGFLLSNLLVWWFYRDVGTLNIWKFQGDWRFSEASGMEFFGSLFFILVHTLQLSKSTSVSFNWGVNSFVVGSFYGALIWWSMTVTGGSFNPSYAFAKQIVDSFDTGDDKSINHIWVYVLWPFLAAPVAWGLYEFIYKKAYEDGDNKQVDVKKVNEAY